MSLPGVQFVLLAHLRFPLRLALAIAAAVLPARAQLLTKASEVRALTVAQAEQGLPVKLRGVVVFIEPASVFIQDDTSTTFFRPIALGALRIGDEVEVEGRTRMGLFQPGIDTSPFRIVGRAPVPPGIPVGYDDLASGRYHYRRVAVEGVLRSIELVDETRSLVRLTLGSRVLEVRIEAAPDRERSLVDARVRIAGLAAGLINERRQLVQPFVRVTDWSDVTILQAAPPPAGVPLISAAELLAFRDAGFRAHRVRIEGVVTAGFPRGAVFLRQGDAAFGVKFRAAPPLAPGDRVELVGFPEMDRYSASVADAELLRRTPGEPPTPIPVDALEQLSGLHDGHLVVVTAAVRDAFKVEGGMALLLQGRTRAFEARLPEGVDPPAAGSEVRLTAVCIVESARRGNNPFSSSPDSVSLRARSAADLVVLQNPSWWTARRLAASLAALAAVTLLAGLWIAILRRQVSRQTAALRCRIESEAALGERQRIAREFHDSLEQDLTGLGLRLDAVATRALDEKGRHIIDVSRGLLARIQAETRNFVSDLRDPTEHDGDLVKSLEAIADAHSSGPVEVRVQFAAEPPTLPAGTVHHLRMMARESVTNALKHAQPSHVTIQVASENGLVLRIVDDGCGFDPGAKTVGKDGHFGCIGMRERARKLGARVAWHSALGQGCTVEIVLPAPAPGRGPERKSPAAPAGPAPALRERTGASQPQSS